jgi:hypothetical protein
MESIADILGGAQILLDVAYDLQDSFEEYLNTDHSTQYLSEFPIILFFHSICSP